MSLKTHTALGGNGLLERDEQFATLFEALGDARLGHGRVVLVAGEAGAGKTALVRGFCDAVAGRARILPGACDALSTPRPLGPFLDVVEGGDGLGELVRGGTQPADVFGPLRAWLGEEPTVLVLEDLHWGDEATLDVLRLLTRRIEDVSALVVGTFRDDGLPRSHPMRILLGDLATTASVDRLALAPLSREAVRELAVGHDVDPEVLYRTTEGNPFFVTQVLASGAAGVPTTVRDAVLARTAGLDRAALDLLEVVALVPPRAEPWLLDAVAGDSLDRIEDCLSSGLVASDERGVSFRHELARLATVDVTPSTRRRAIHRRVLDALAGRPDQELDYARLAHHAEAAGDAAAVLLYAPDAARSAAAAGAYREAAAQYERALRFAAALEPGERAELLEGRSRACYLADDQLEAIEVIREAIRCRQEQRAPLQEARALSELADYLSCRGFLCDAQETKDRAFRLVEGHAEQREHAYVLQAAGRFRLDGDYDASIELGGRAVEIGERFGDEHVAGHARVTVGVATGRRDLGAGLRLLEEAVQLARGTGQPEVVARAFNAMGYICAARYRHEQADAYYEAGLEHCAEHTSDLWRINMLALSGLSFLAQGRFDDASRRAVAILDDPRESPWPHHTALVVLALVRARRGDPGARDALAETSTVDLQPEEFDAVVDQAAAHAEIAWMDRRPDEVHDATEATLQEAIERGDTESTSRLVFWRRLAELETGVPTGASGPYALVLAGKWEQAADEWARRGQPYETALALSQSGDVAALRRAHAELQRIGARPLAALVARELRDLGERDIPRGPRRSTRTNDAELTTRELDVLVLLADGLRNADIADRLVVSRRTVDHHVSAILRKLGVRTRGEAVAAATRIGLLEDR